MSWEELNAQLQALLPGFSAPSADSEAAIDLYERQGQCLSLINQQATTAPPSPPLRMRYAGAWWGGVGGDGCSGYEQ